MRTVLSFLLRNPAFYLLFVLGISFQDVMFGGKTLLNSNAINTVTGLTEYDRHRPADQLTLLDPGGHAEFEEPVAHLIAESYRRGEIPLWNPYQGSGTPLWSAMQHAVLFPLKFIVFLSPSEAGWDVYLLLRLFLAGAFTFAFLRRIGLGRQASLAGAIFYMLCGHLTLYVNMVFINSAFLLPLLLLSIEYVLSSPGRRQIALLAGTIGLIFLGEFPESIFFALFYGACYFLVKAHEQSRAQSALQAKYLVRRGFFAALWGVSLGAIVILPFLDYLRYAAHGHHSDIGKIALPFAESLLLFSPWFAGPLHQADGINWNLQPGYIGLCATVLVVWAIFTKGSRYKSRFFLWAVFFFLLKTYGFPGLNSLVGELPLFSRSYFPRYFAPEFMFSVGVILATQLECVRREEVSKSKLWLSNLLAAGFVLGLAAATFNKQTLQPYLAHMLSALVFTFGISLVIFGLASLTSLRYFSSRILSCALLGLMVFELYWLMPKDRYDRFEAYPKNIGYIRFLASRDGVFRVFGQNSVMPPNTASAFRLYDIGSLDALYVRRYFEFVNHLLTAEIHRFDPHTGRFRVGYPEIRIGRNRYVNLLNLGYVVGQEEDYFKEMGYGEELFVDVTQESEPIGEIVSGRKVRQEFMMSRPGLGGISVLFATYKRSTSGLLRFRLLSPGHPTEIMYETMIDASGIADNSYYFVSIPRPASGERHPSGKYYFEIEGVSTQSGSAPTIWASRNDVYEHGLSYLNGDSFERDLGFKVFLREDREAGAPEYEIVYRYRTPRVNVVVFRNSSAYLPRAFVVRRGIFMADDGEALEMMKDPDFDFRTTAPIEWPEKFGTFEYAVPSIESPLPEVLYRGLNSVSVRVQMDTPGFLILTDTYAPGWKAYVDGKEARIFPAYHAFRSVYLDKGEHQVEFRYRPLSFSLGCLISLVALLPLAYSAFRGD